jgi:hypothetical protein
MHHLKLYRMSHVTRNPPASMRLPCSAFLLTHFPVVRALSSRHAVMADSTLSGTPFITLVGLPFTWIGLTGIESFLFWNSYQHECSSYSPYSTFAYFRNIAGVNLVKYCLNTVPLTKKKIKLKVCKKWGKQIAKFSLLKGPSESLVSLKQVLSIQWQWNTESSTSLHKNLRSWYSTFYYFSNWSISRNIDRFKRL